MSDAITRILLVDDHELMRRGLRTLLETQPGWEICGEAADGREAVQLARSLAPHIVIMDLTMPRLNGFEASRQITKHLPGVRVLILSAHESESLVREALEAGIHGYILKSAAGQNLIGAVEALQRGETFFASHLAATLHDTKFYAQTTRSKPKDPLTRREREVLQLLAEGLGNKAVGKALNISVKTAETHRARVMRKLNAESVADLVRYAIRNGFIAP